MWDQVDMIARERRADFLREAVQASRARSVDVPARAKTGLIARLSAGIHNRRRAA